MGLDRDALWREVNVDVPFVRHEVTDLLVLKVRGPIIRSVHLKDSSKFQCAECYYFFNLNVHGAIYIKRCKR